MYRLKIGSIIRTGGSQSNIGGLECMEYSYGEKEILPVVLGRKIFEKFGSAMLTESGGSGAG